MAQSRRKGFTLIELLIFSAIFALIAGAFITILVIVVQVQSQQSSSAEVQQQGQFLEQQINYYVQSARLVDMPLDTATGTIALREFLASSSLDPTTFSLTNGMAYLTQGPAGATEPLTSSRVTVSNLSSMRHFNVNSTSSPYGTDSVSYSFTVSEQSGNQTYNQTFQSSASVLAPVPQIALIQQAKAENNNATSTSMAEAYASPNEGGDLLLAVVANKNLVTASMSDTASNTWTEVASTTYPAYSEEVALFAARNVASSTNTPTVTFGGSGAYNPSLFIYEYRGAATSNEFDAFGAQTQSNTTVPTSPTVYPTSSVELLFGIDSDGYPSNAIPTAGVGYTIETSSTANNNTQVFVEDQNQDITGGVSAPWTLNTNVSSSAMIGTFIAFTVEPITFTISTYRVGANPQALAFDSHTNTVWTGNSDNTVTKINDTTFATTTYDVGNNPDGIAFDSHTDTLWTANYNDNTVTKINDTTFATTTYAVGSEPSAIAFDSNTNTIWVANYNDNTVTKINDTTFATSTYTVGSEPYGVAFDSHTNTIWVANNNDNTVTKINDTTFATSTYGVGSGPYGIAFDSHTNTVWTGNIDDDTVTQINDTTFATTTYGVGTEPYAVAFDSHTNSIWAPNLGDNTVTQTNDTTYASTTYGVGSYPIAVAFDSHTNAIWVANLGGNSVTQFTPNQ